MKRSGFSRCDKPSTTARLTIKPKRCKAKGCKETYIPTGNTLRCWCSPECGYTIARAKLEQAETKKRQADRAMDRKAREEMKPRAKWLAECQVIANAIARARDRADGCISCDKPATWGGQWHGSHFRSVGAASAVRLNLWNIHKACSICNNHLSGNIANYRPRLIQKIGADRVAWLESQNQLVRHDIGYLRRYKAVMGKRLRRVAGK